MENNNKRNIGILAHVDAGKTTLTEQLIYLSGNSRSLGRVDNGTTHSDTLEVEKQRGISVKSTEINFTYENHNINIIDTPGHIDFAGEVQRSIRILDGAITVISAVEGIQPQTEIYFNCLKSLNIPTMFFINKLDRLGCDIFKVLNDIKSTLTSNIIPLQVLDTDSNGFSIVDIFSFHNEIYNGEHSYIFEEIISILSDGNESILEKYYEETLDINDIQEEIKLQSLKGLVHPVYFGTAINGYGVVEILKGIIEYLPPPKFYNSDELSALVYKITHNKSLGTEYHVKVFSGQLTVKDEINNSTQNLKNKISLMKKSIDLKLYDVKTSCTGDIILAYGLNANIGDILGNPNFIPKTSIIANPVLKVKVTPKKNDDYIPLVDAFKILQREDPLLNMEWIREKREINISITGLIQLEILHNLLITRFDIDVTFSEPSIIYKETPSNSGFAFESYTMPKPCWAVVKFLIEALPSGSGIVFESKVKTEDIMLKYQREIRDNLNNILKQGFYGWNVTDIKITLIDGEDHVMHSRPGDFAAATAMALMKGFLAIGMTLLEPILHLKISAPETISGKIINEIIQMRGTIKESMILNNVFTITCIVPASTSLDFPVKLGIMSSGKAILTSSFYGYSPCNIELGKTTEHIGVNPLDRSKFILHVRNGI
ncbi:MAG: TetM/TetW/TetO/TetS family tetracycline resistance ribosomal protection protein [Clostridium sp.]